jgi:hypothetical protein
MPIARAPSATACQRDSKLHVGQSLPANCCATCSQQEVQEFHCAASLPKEIAMKKLFALALMAGVFSNAYAADSACMTAAKEKKLAGAAQKSFVKKCETDAKAKCEMAATEKKLAGAAKNSNVKKCVQETGPAAG